MTWIRSVGFSPAPFLRNQATDQLGSCPSVTDQRGSACEGNLSGTSLFDVAGASSDETQVLKRNTLWPKQDFVVLPLEAEMVGPIMAAVGGTVPRGIIHIQVQKDGRLELGLYDNFAPKFMFFGSSLTSTFLATLQDTGTLVHWTE